MLTAHDNPDYLLGAVQAGAAGYVLKQDAFSRITPVVRSVLDGEAQLDGGITMRLLKRLERPPGETEKPPRPRAGVVRRTP